MALTNKEIFNIADSDACNPDDRGWGPKFSVLLFGKAIEAAATAPLLEQIAQLEQQLAEARKDTEKWKNSAVGAVGRSHLCKRCGYGYTPAGDNEDCPRCGFNGIDTAV